MKSLATILLPCVVLGMTACDQPEPLCATAIGAFTTKYTLVSKEGDGTCDELAGGRVGVSYYPAHGDNNLPDHDNARLAIQDYSLVGAPFDEADPNVSLGEYSRTEPDGEGLCHVPTLNASAVMDPEAGIDLRYEWSDIAVRVGDGAYGNSFTARLKYTDQGCTAEYEVEAIYPSVGCGQGEVDPIPSDDLCSPEAIAANGSRGFDVSMEVVCDPELLMCVRKKSE